MARRASPFALTFVALLAFAARLALHEALLPDRANIAAPVVPSPQHLSPDRRDRLAPLHVDPSDATAVDHQGHPDAAGLERPAAKTLFTVVDADHVGPWSYPAYYEAELPSELLDVFAESRAGERLIKAFGPRAMRPIGALHAPGEHAADDAAGAVILEPMTRAVARLGVMNIGEESPLTTGQFQMLSVRIGDRLSTVVGRRVATGFNARREDIFMMMASAATRPPPDLPEIVRTRLWGIVDHIELELEAARRDLWRLIWDSTTQRAAMGLRARGVVAAICDGAHVRTVSEGEDRELENLILSLAEREQRLRSRLDSLLRR